MTGPGIEPGTPASLVRCSTTELSRSISTVHLSRTTTFLPPYKVFTLEDTHNKHKITLNKEGQGTTCSMDGRNEHNWTRNRTKLMHINAYNRATFFTIIINAPANYMQKSNIMSASVQIYNIVQ